MQKKDYPDHSVSPNYIKELSDCEIFVFGSNLEGFHHGGAARIAYEKFGAEWGVGDGSTGKCYAIPTMHGGVNEIKPYVDKFIHYAKQHPMNRFLVTRVGCGIAGFRDEEIAPLFSECIRMPNVALPVKWMETMVELDVLSDLEPEEVPSIPEVITDEVLKDLTEKYLYEIGAGLRPRKVPIIRVRYVDGTNEFGYTSMRNIFFFDGWGMYVWEQDPRWKEEHNQDLVEEIFKDQCYGRGFVHRVIYAGVQTGFKDCNGKMIYTGDVVQFYDNPNSTYAVGSLKFGYGCLLDNHALMLKTVEAKHMKRVGTVFFQLQDCPFPSSVNERVRSYNGWFDTAEERQLKALMARYTPNFDQEVWKYKALEALEVEFDWNK